MFVVRLHKTGVLRHPAGQGMPEEGMLRHVKRDVMSQLLTVSASWPDLSNSALVLNMHEGQEVASTAAGLT